MDDPSDILVNTVNCVGVMGAGVALAFKRAWPNEMQPYVEACREGEIKPGSCVLFPLNDGRKWAALATKNHWMYPSQLPWIENGLRELARLARADGARSIGLPAPGCGNGGLHWSDVRPLILRALSGFDVTIYAPRPMSNS